MKQRTIAKEATVSGKALHSGAEVSLTIKPAPENTGIVFNVTACAFAPKEMVGRDGKERMDL